MSTDCSSDSDSDSSWTPDNKYQQTNKKTYLFRRRRKVDILGSNDDDDICITISKKKKQCDNSMDQKKQCILANAELKEVPFPINTFQDLYELASMCYLEGNMYRDCQKLPDIWSTLKEINDLIGLTNVKNALCNMILFELQNQANSRKEKYWRHMVITGPPGTGKTTIAKIIARLLNKLGQSDSDDIIVGNSRNMISDWQGQTKTMVDSLVSRALKSSGILFIDEAPNLNDGRNQAVPDSYGKSCLDTLMELMDEHKEKLIVILSGYAEEMESNVLAINKGIRRRIQWWFHIDSYSAGELYSIFKKNVLDTGYQLPPNMSLNESWFEKRKEFFPYFGGSVRNYVEKVCTLHSKKTFGKINQSTLDIGTINEGYELYKLYNMDSNQKNSPAFVPNRGDAGYLSEHCL